VESIDNNASSFVETKVYYYKDILNAFKWMLQITLQQIPPAPLPPLQGILHIISFVSKWLRRSSKLNIVFSGGFHILK
jgi:hypothetical protein